MVEDKKNWTVRILLIVIAILIIFIIIKMVILPKVNNYVLQKQIQAQEVIFQNLFASIQQLGYVQVYYNNQTMTLVPYVPSQGG